MPALRILRAFPASALCVHLPMLFVRCFTPRGAAATPFSVCLTDGAVSAAIHSRLPGAAGKQVAAVLERLLASPKFQADIAERTRLTIDDGGLSIHCMADRKQGVVLLACTTPEYPQRLVFPPATDRAGAVGLLAHIGAVGANVPAPGYDSSGVTVFSLPARASLRIRFEPWDGVPHAAAHRRAAMSVGAFEKEQPAGGADAHTAPIPVRGRRRAESGARLRRARGRARARPGAARAGRGGRGAPNDCYMLLHDRYTTVTWPLYGVHTTVTIDSCAA